VNRKRQSQVDGLGRLISVTEQDPATGALSLVTTYSYDTLDNLTGVNQGGQTRSFSYDPGIKSLNGLTLVASQQFGDVTVRIWQLPGTVSFFADPGVQAIMRQFSYPGASSIDEAYAIYLYLHGLPADGMGAFIGWVERRVGGRQPYQP
jgi:hypothetical protein